MRRPKLDEDSSDCGETVATSNVRTLSANSSPGVVRKGVNDVKKKRKKKKARASKEVAESTATTTTAKPVKKTVRSKSKK